MININKLKDFIKSQKTQLKQSKAVKSEQKIINNKPIFVKLVGTLQKKVIVSLRRHGHYMDFMKNSYFYFIKDVDFSLYK